LQPPVLGVHNVTFGYYGNRSLFKKSDFCIDMGSRVSPKSVGKSTFLKLLIGELAPQQGEKIKIIGYIWEGNFPHTYKFFNF
jgi:ATPase subunit of ABC transporter with duplicated ATPase domains